MSFSYTQIDNPTGSGPFTFATTYSNSSDVAVMGYNGKVWSILKIASITDQTVTLNDNVDGLKAIRIAANASKVYAAVASGNDGNALDETSSFHDALIMCIADPTDRTGSYPMTPESVTVGGLKSHFSQSTSPKNGFMDYNNSGAPISIVADTWTDIPNDGAGSFTNKGYKPEGINELMDDATGYIDPTELSLGDTLLVRNDYTVTPNTNNALLEFRYSLGNSGNGYTLECVEARLDNGSGIGYRFSLKSDLIYMGDTNTKDNPIKLQIKLSSNGTLANAGSVIQTIRY